MHDSKSLEVSASEQCIQWETCNLQTSSRPAMLATLHSKEEKTSNGRIFWTAGGLRLCRFRCFRPYMLFHQNCSFINSMHFFSLCAILYKCSQHVTYYICNSLPHMLCAEMSFANLTSRQHWYRWGKNEISITIFTKWGNNSSTGKRDDQGRLLKAAEQN